MRQWNGPDTVSFGKVGSTTSPTGVPPPLADRVWDRQFEADVKAGKLDAWLNTTN
jgi:hypothetical protein